MSNGTKTLPAINDPILAAKVAKALEGHTAESAAAKLAAEQAALSNGAKKAWATRRANGFDGREAAKKAHVTRRAIKAAFAQLAATAKTAGKLVPKK